jgi:hypothetical protein
MNKPLPLFAVSSMLLLSPLSALAQVPAPPPPAAPAPAPEAPPADVPPLPPAEAVPANVPPAPPSADMPPDAAAPPPTLEERVGEVEGKVSGMEEGLSAAQSTLGSLNRIKLSGYIQGRYEWHDDSVQGVSATGAPTETNRFYVRRGRLKVTYAGTNMEYMLQIDAVGSGPGPRATGVTLKDAEATFVDTWTPLGLRLTMGQFKWPFGYEVLQSSGDREMPEPSRVTGALFPGERDRGVRLVGRYDVARVQLALVNGTGTQDAIYGGTDSTPMKDVVGRIGADLDFLAFGVSGYYGRALKTTLPTSASVSGTDTNMDGKISGDEITLKAATPSTSTRYRRLRLGADAQFYLDIPGVGGLALKGEFFFAKDTNLRYGAQTDPNSCLDVTAMGWILTAVQNIGDYAGAVLRVDYYDPSRSKSISDMSGTTSCMAQKTAAQGDAFTTVGGGLLFYPAGNLRATFVYEHIMKQSKDIGDDIFTAQLQAKF